jgi:hypothetical protein
MPPCANVVDYAVVEVIEEDNTGQSRAESDVVPVLLPHDTVYDEQHRGDGQRHSFPSDYAIRVEEGRKYFELLGRVFPSPLRTCYPLP